MCIRDRGNYDSALGLSKIEKYAKVLGLDMKSGVEITEEIRIFQRKVLSIQLSDRVVTVSYTHLHDFPAGNFCGSTKM